MPNGACVIRRDGKRGAVWSVKYRDADGRQVKDRLGRELGRLDGAKGEGRARGAPDGRETGGAAEAPLRHLRLVRGRVACDLPRRQGAEALDAGELRDTDRAAPEARARAPAARAGRRRPRRALPGGEAAGRLAAADAQPPAEPAQPRDDGRGESPARPGEPCDWHRSPTRASAPLDDPSRRSKSVASNELLPSWPRRGRASEPGSSKPASSS